MWVLGIELRWSDLAAGFFICWAVSSVQEAHVDGAVCSRITALCCIRAQKARLGRENITDTIEFRVLEASCLFLNPFAQNMFLEHLHIGFAPGAKDMSCQKSSLV